VPASSSLYVCYMSASLKTVVKIGKQVGLSVIRSTCVTNKWLAFLLHIQEVSTGDRLLPNTCSCIVL
jgi:hypothetical protein